MSVVNEPDELAVSLSPSKSISAGCHGPLDDNCHGTVALVGGKMSASNAERKIQMNASPPVSRRPIRWSALFWALPLAYVFYDPWQQRANLGEWLVTSVALAGILVLLLIGMAFWEDKDKRVLRVVCGSVLAVAICFLAYRPSGGIFFPMAAVFVPFAVGANIPIAVALIAGIAALFGIEWWWLYADTYTAGPLFPLAVALEILLAGGGMTLYSREAPATTRTHKAAERERIARDLHDVLGHTLSSIALKSELARRLFHDDPERALAEIGDVERISRVALDEVRETIHGYHAGDIHSELDRVESILKAAGIAVDRRFDSAEIDPAQERVLALILREAVTNVVRHSKAAACRLILFRLDHEYRLEVSDDGCGGIHHEGVGMRSIRSRIEAVGGSASWSSDSGTQLIVKLPIIASVALP
jgi:two-component system sensor histidine kinase DesK